MEKNKSLTINLSYSEGIDLESFIVLNKIEDEVKFNKKCWKQGFDIEKYGLLVPVDNIKEKIIEIEKIVEVPVDRIVEVEVVKEIIKEVFVEKIIEKPTEIIIEKVVEVSGSEESQKKQQMLQDTIQKLRQELQNKTQEIVDLNQKLINRHSQKWRSNTKVSLKVPRLPLRLRASHESTFVATCSSLNLRIAGSLPLFA